MAEAYSVTGRAGRRERWFAAALAVGLTVLYFAFRTQYHNVDAIKSAGIAEVPAGGTFLHQNHLLFTPLVWLVLKVLRAVGYGGSSLAASAALSSIFAGAAAGGFFLFLRRLGATFAVALLTVAAAAFSAAWWFFAGEAELLSGITFFVVGALLLLAAPVRRWYGSAAVAVWLSVGAWFHITLMLFAPVAAILLAENKEGRWLRLAVFGAIYGALAFPAYVVVFRLYHYPRGWTSFYEWITFLHWWGGWGRFDWGRFGEGASRLVAAAVAPGSDLNCRFDRLASAEVLRQLGPGVAFLAAAVAVVAAGGRRLWRERRWWLAAAAVWFVVYQTFFSWWEPMNAEWWIATTMPLWVLFAVAAPRRLGFVLPAAAVIFCLAGVNFTRLILPRSRPGRDGAERTARVIAAATRDGDTVLISRMRVRVWLDNLTKYGRRVMGSDNGRRSEDVEIFIDDVAKGPAGAAVVRGDAFLTDYEMDSQDLDRGFGGDGVRASLFDIIRNAEAVTLVPVEGQLRILYRCRGPAELESLRIYEAERGTRKAEFRVLRETGDTQRFKIRIPAKGRYVMGLQARGRPARNEWPAVRVFVNGLPLSAFDVTTDYWWFYEMRTRLKAGTHEVKVVLRNGLADRAAGEKRFLYVNRLAVFRDPAEGRGAGKPSG